MNSFFRLPADVKSLAVTAFVVVAMIAAMASQVAAQSADAVTGTRQVVVGGTLFLTVRAAWGGLTPEQRAAAVQDRINAALSEGPLHPSDISVAKVDGDWIVLLKGKRLYTADYDTAKLDNTAPQDLANSWADFLKKTLPELTAPTNNAPTGTTAPAASQ
jgi:hypothetical protein